MSIQYGIRQGKRKIYNYGDYESKQEAIDAMIDMQLRYGRRGMYIVKLVPYGASETLRQAIPLNSYKTIKGGV